MTTTRDITPADLTHPATVLGGAMVEGWTGPASSHPDLDEDAKLFMDGLPLGHTGEVGLRRIERAHLTTLDFTRPEVRDRARRVLGTGEATDPGWGRSGDGRHRLPCPEDSAALLGQPIGMYHCPVCGMMLMAGMRHLQPPEDYELEYGQDWPAGYARQPYRLGWITDAEEAGTITPVVAAALWWCAVARVVAGLGPLTLLRPWMDTGPAGRSPGERRFARRGLPDGYFIATSWGRPSPKARWVSEDDAKWQADAAALRAGHALLNRDSPLLPLPGDVVARLAVKP